ncbi:MAG: CaiB/BaiF CoA-transferase family protein [Chloroflexi bacterium]|nr:CaiB/BaiF CoA-transferase family protein [Chloroflexota bacterium]MDA1239228.1 CaiB/BaiF CoA-transferase family protein [Chloroflexota bacterium]
MPPLPTTGPLAGVRVLDLTWVLSGPFCTATLADLGADVIKLERPPYGDVSRTTGPIIDGESGYFFSINRGKRSISLDLSSEEGKAIFLRLVRQVDVVVENFTPGKMDTLGLGYAALSEVNPALIYAAISGYGQTGPMREKPALDVIVQGAGGVMSVTGHPDGPPARPGLSLGDIAAGLYCAVGILAALHERRDSGKGQLLDISMLDCQIAIQENAYMRYFLTGETPVRLGTRHPSAVPFQAFPTADGWMVLALAWGVPNQWALMCSELDIPELIDDERFHSAAARSRNHAALEPLLNDAFKRRTTTEWVTALERFGIPCGPLNSIPDTASMPQVEERGMLPEVPHRAFGKVRLANSPVRLSRTPAGIRGTSPDMGQHSREVLAELLDLDAAALEDLVSRQVVWEERPEVELG